MAAAYRAMETDHPKAMFHDPLAAKLAGERGKKIIDSLPGKAFVGGWSVVIRTRIIDDFIQDAIAEGVDTILNLGAGLDTRPYRMELPESLRWIEVDYPHVIEMKESRLSGETPRCRLERVKPDLADVEARRTLLDKVAAHSKNIFRHQGYVVLHESGWFLWSCDQVFCRRMSSWTALQHNVA